jgi:hypothetical protein
MATVTYKNLGNAASGLWKFLNDEFGIRPSLVGNDLVLNDDAVDLMLTENALTLHPQIALRKGNEVAVAQALYKQIPDDLKKYNPPIPSELHGGDDCGKLSNFHLHTTHLAVAGEVSVTSVLASRIVPMMRDEFGAQAVTGISVSASAQQSLISLSKIAMLAERFAPEDVKRKIDAGALNGVVPYGLQVLAFLDAMTRLSPILFTMPVHRNGCAWHFQSPGMWTIPTAPANGLVTTASAVISPLATEPHLYGLHGLAGMSETAIWKYLRFCTDSLNRLMRFLNDPRTFLRADGTVDLLRKMQTYSAINLLFADVAALNFSTVGHNRISYAMSALDKIANLRVQLGTHAGSYSESEAMTDLVSESQGQQLIGLVSGAMEAFAYTELASSFSVAIERCYSEFHSHLSKQGAGAAVSERTRLSRVRSQRNLRHGTFLLRNQFEELFFESDGTLPATIGSFPFFLMLGLLSDPQQFIDFRPAVTT